MTQTAVKLEGHNGPVLAASVSPQADWILSSDACGASLLWRTTNLTSSFELPKLNTPIVDGMFTEERTAVVACHLGKIVVMDLTNLSVARKINLGDGKIVNGCTVSSVRSDCVFVASDDGAVTSVDFRSAQKSSWKNTLGAPVTSIAASGNVVVDGDACGVVRCRDIRSMDKPLWKEECHQDIVSSIVTCSQDLVVSLGLEGAVCVLNASPFCSGERIESLAQHVDRNYGRCLLRGSGSNDTVCFGRSDGSTAIYKVSSDKSIVLTSAVDGHSSAVSKAILLNLLGNSCLLTASHDGSLLVGAV